MTDGFMTVLRMSATGSIVILAVLLVRLALGKAPKRWSWALWAVVLFRLLTPFGIPVKVPMPDVRLPAFFGAETGTKDAALPGYGEPDPDPEERYDRTEGFPWYTENQPSTEPSASLPDGGGDLDAAPGTALSETPGNPGPEPEEPPSEEPVLGPFGLDSRQIDRILSAAALVWIAGAAAMIVWNLASCALLKRKLREAVPVGGNLYETDRVDTAFVFGLFSPRVYLPAGLGQVEKACVAEHERVHIRRLDPLWRLLSFLALTAHWFNPLVWLAFRLSGKDMEMSCDEAVLKRAPVDIRAAYSRTLVKFASRGRIDGPALAFGEGETGSRVKNVMRYKKPVLWVSIAAAAVLVLSAVVLAVNPRAKDTSLPYARYSVDEIVFFNDVRSEEILSHMLMEIAGDGSVWVRFENSNVGWDSSSSVEPISTKGLTEFVREQTGVKIPRITAAFRHANRESTSEWLFFSTVPGDVYFASVRTELGVMRSVSWLCSLKNDPLTAADEKLTFCEHSLWAAVGREIEPLELTEPSGSPYAVCTFRAGLDLRQLSVMASWIEEKIPYTFGVAVFKTEGRSTKLVNWALAEEATFPGWHPSSKLIGDAIGPAGGEFALELPDGRTLFCEVKLPETKRSLLGPKETGSGECPIGFRVDGVPKPADESGGEPTDGTEAAPDQAASPDLDLLSPRWESWKLFPYKEGMAEYIRLMPGQAGLTEEKLAAVDSELLMKREDGEYWIFDSLYGDGWTGEDALACLAIGPGELAAVDVYKKSGNAFEGTVADPEALSALFDAIREADVMTRETWNSEIGWSDKSGTEEGYAAEKILELTGRYGKVARLFFYPHSDLLWLGDSAIALARGEGEELLGRFENALGHGDAAGNAETVPSDGARAEIDAAYDAFLAEHYDPHSWIDAAYATRKTDLDRDGWDELVVYRCPAESGYPLDIYEWDPSKGEIRAFSTTMKDVPASLNALPGGTFTAEIGGHDIDKPDGFYGDFFSVNGQTYLISQVSSEFYKKIECYAFSNVRGSLAAAKIFSAERFGEWYYDENRRNTAEINGEAIPYDSFGDALLAWRSSWNNVPGGGDVILWSEPLWSEAEVSGWPVAWHPPLSEEDRTGERWTAPDGLFTLTIPAGWEEEIFITPGRWTEGGDLRIDFYDRRDYEGENGWGGGLLGSIVLYAHRLDRMYPTYHQELKTVTYPDGRVFDLTLVYPGDVQCSPTNKGHYDYELTRFRKAAQTAEFPEGCETSLAPERAALMLADQLKIAYENVYGPFEPLGTDPSPAEDEVWLRYAVTRLTVSDGRYIEAWEDDEFYWFPVLGNFAVDKKGGDIYRTYEKEGTVSGAIRFVPFDPYDPNAFGELGNTEPEGQSETHSEGPSKGQTDAGPEGGTLWTSPTGLFSLDLPEGFLDAVEVRTGEQWEGGSDDPEYWATFVLKDPGDGDGVLGSLVLYPHMLERYYLTGRQEFSTLTFADGRSFEFVLVLPEDPALNNPSYFAGIYSHRLIQLRTAAASAKFPEGARVTVSPGNAAELLGTALTHAYVNIYGHEPFPLAEDPSPCPDEEYLCYAINRILTGTLGAKGAWEDETYYWYPVIFPFAVDKETGAIYKVYNGLETVFYPFDPEDPDALAFAG